MKKLILLTATLAACVLMAFTAYAASEPDEEDRPPGVIVINPQDLWQVVVAVGAGIVTLAGAGGVITSAIRKAKSPNKIQNERLDALEEHVKEIDERLVLGNKRFESDTTRVCTLEDSVKASNKVIIESLQALTAHAIDGNNTEKLHQAEKALNDYLIGKI